MQRQCLRRSAYELGHAGVALSLQPRLKLPELLLIGEEPRNSPITDVTNRLSIAEQLIEVDLVADPLRRRTRPRARSHDCLLGSIEQPQCAIRGGKKPVHTHTYGPRLRPRASSSITSVSSPPVTAAVAQPTQNAPAPALGHLQSSLLRLSEDRRRRRPTRDRSLCAIQQGRPAMRLTARARRSSSTPQAQLGLY